MTFEVLTSDKYTGAQYLPLKEKQILRTEKKKKKKNHIVSVIASFWLRASHFCFPTFKTEKFRKHISWVRTGNRKLFYREGT